MKLNDIAWRFEIDALVAKRPAGPAAIQDGIDIDPHLQVERLHGVDARPSAVGDDGHDGLSGFGVGEGV